MAKKRIIIIALVVAILVGFVCWGIHDNSALEINKFDITSKKLPEEFNGFKIAQISDLHNAQIGKDNEKLLNMLASTQPDIIAITGDMVDSRHTNIQVALDFAKSAVEIAPCYYVAGNHESRIENYNDFEKGLADIGVVILNDNQINLEKSGQIISLMGIKDTTFEKGFQKEKSKKYIANKVKNFKFEKDKFSVLLAHRPELLEIYANYGFDLVLSGHTHGGQVRLPFIGSIAVPSQGFFPKYDCGLYQQENTKMIISRGIGNSMIPFRINNPPEIVLITLTK